VTAQAAPKISNKNNNNNDRAVEAELENLLTMIESTGSNLKRKRRYEQEHDNSHNPGTNAYDDVASNKTSKKLPKIKTKQEKREDPSYSQGGLNERQAQYMVMQGKAGADRTQREKTRKR